MSVSDNPKIRVFAMRLHTGKDFKPVSAASTLVKDFVVYAEGKEAARIQNNFCRLVHVPLHVTAREISIKWLAANGAESVRLFLLMCIKLQTYLALNNTFDLNYSCFVRDGNIRINNELHFYPINPKKKDAQASFFWLFSLYVTFIQFQTMQTPEGSLRMPECWK